MSQSNSNSLSTYAVTSASKPSFADSPQKLIKRVVSEIKKSPEGGTIWKESSSRFVGNGTFYLVGIKRFEVIQKPGETLEWTVARFLAGASGYDADAIGWWVDSESGLLHLDASLFLFNLETAVEVGVREKQIAIGKFQDGVYQEEIRL